MPTYVTSTGLIIKTREQILSEMQEGVRQEISEGINQSTDSFFGQYNGVFADQMASGWLALQESITARSPRQASGYLLRQFGIPYGIDPLGASKSVLKSVTVNLAAGFTLPSGSIAAVSGVPSSRFLSNTSVTNSGGSAANFSVDFTAETAGPVVANAGTLTVRVSPGGGGWNSVTNPEDAILGSVEESDPQYRLRYYQAVKGSGLRTRFAIEQKVLKVTNVINAKLFENDTDFVDASSLPAHSFEVAVRDNSLADNDAIAQAIFDAGPEGIATYGTSSGTATLANGQTKTVNFSRIIPTDVYLIFNLRVNQTFATSAIADLKTAIAQWGDDNLQIGDTLWLSALAQPIFDFGGIEDVDQTFAGLAPGPSGTADLIATNRQIFDLDTGRIEINIVSVL